MAIEAANSFVLGTDGPYRSAAAVVPDTDFTVVSRAIWVGVGGNITVDLVDGGAGVLLKNVPVGELRIRAVKVQAAGTTATDMVALW